jgi:PKD repeat protein
MYAQPLPYWDQVKPTETTALFFAGPITGRAPLTVWFWDMSLGGTSWSWDFGDGGTSGARSPYYTYQNDGQWVAAHTVNGPGGTDLFAIVIDMLEDTTPTAQPTATNTPTFRPTSTNTSTPFPTATGTLPTPTPTRTGSLPPTSTPTRTPTLDSHATPSPTPMCQELIDILLTMQQQPVPFEEILEVVLNWYQTNVEPTPTPRPGTEVFQSGDALIDFSVFPDGSQMNGVPSGFTPGTYLVDQFASAGVRFRSTISPYPQENPLPADLGCGVVGGPSDNYLQGMRYAPPNGMDARTVFEVRFDSPVRRAGVLRSRGFNFSITNAITRFYDSTGSLIVTRTTSGAPAYHSLEVPSGNPGVKRIEITSSDPVGGNAGGIDDLMFSQVGDLSVPPALLYEP